MKNNRKLLRDRQAIKTLAEKIWSLHPTAADIPDVVSIDDMVRLSGFTKGSLYVFSTRDDFPGPVARKGKRLFWARKEFEQWRKKRVRQRA